MSVSCAGRGLSTARACRESVPDASLAPRGSRKRVFIPTTFLGFPSRPNSLVLGAAGGQIPPAPSPPVRSGGKRKEKTRARRGEEEEVFPGNESFAAREERGTTRISTDTKIKSQE